MEAWKAWTPFSNATTALRYKSGEAMDPITRRLPLSFKEPEEKTSLQQGAQAIEEMFIDFLLQVMRKNTAVINDPPSSATHLYTALWDTEIAKQIAGQGNFGLAQQLMDVLSPPLYTEKKTQKEPNNESE